MSLFFTKTLCRCWKYIYFWQSYLALKKRKIMEIWKNKKAKSFRIFLFTLPDIDDLIKHTFAFWHTQWGDLPDLGTTVRYCKCQKKRLLDRWIGSIYKVWLNLKHTETFTRFTEVGRYSSNAAFMEFSVPIIFSCA